jgi:hypothetical protein
MRKSKRLERARQLSPSKLGVSRWQRDFWVVMVEHAQSGQPGPPDLSQLDGFTNPAVTRYAVTTPDLWHSFDRYNAGKPYHRQVRPFGFMVMFLLEEDTLGSSSTLRVVAPFNRNPAAAARQAFDRDSGIPVSPKQLKTSIGALRTYYNHPEAKFLNGERGDRGPTRRRHIIARSIVHIGKEANKLDIQSVLGVDPNAQVEFCAVSESRAGRLRATRAGLKTFGPSRVARETGLSRQYLSKLAGGEVVVTEATLAKVEQAIGALEVVEAKRQGDVDESLAWLRIECERIGLRQVALDLGSNAGHLSRILASTRPISRSLVRIIYIKRSQDPD